MEAIEWERYNAVHKCRITVTGPHVRPHDCSYYAVYSTPHTAPAVVNCIIQMRKTAFLHVTTTTTTTTTTSILWPLFQHNLGTGDPNPNPGSPIPTDIPSLSFIVVIIYWLWLRVFIQTFPARVWLLCILGLPDLPYFRPFLPPPGGKPPERTNLPYSVSQIVASLRRHCDTWNFV